MKDIAPELLENLQEAFRIKYNANARVKDLNLKLKSGKATYKEANEMAAELGEMLAEVFGENISADMLPDGRMYYNIGQRVIGPTMTQNYELMSEYAKETQTQINRSCGLGINGKKADLNQDRIDGIVDKLDKDVFEKTKWLLDEPIKNFTQSIVDDTVKTNAKLHHNMGLRPKIIRTEVGNCCKWCKSISGVHDYEAVKDTGNNVFRRHRFCRCTVEYSPGDNRRQNVHSKAWRNEDKSDIIKARKESQKKSKLILKDSQFGKKARKHMFEYGLDPSSEEDREVFKNIIYDICENRDSIKRDVEWRGQDDKVVAYIKGDDVVLVNKDNEYITIMKGGINNERIKNTGKWKVRKLF